MKVTSFLLCLFVCSAERHIDILAALHKGLHQKEEKPKFDILAILQGKQQAPQGPDPTAFLGTILQGTQRGLAKAEKHHDKAVKKARDQIDSLLTKESGKLASAMQQYNSSLSSAVASLEASKNVTKSFLEKAEKASASSNSWEQAAGEEQAQLNAQLSSVESELRKAARTAKNSVREAGSRANLMIADGDVQKLSRKVGDISDLVDKTNNVLVPTDGSAQQSSKLAFVQKGGAVSSMKEAKSELSTALQQARASRDSADKELNSAFDAVEHELTTGAKAIDDDLVASEKSELSTFHAATEKTKLKLPKKEVHPKKPLV